MSFKIFLENAKQAYNESSLSRLWRHNLEHDCGAISAFRIENDEGVFYTKEQNKERSRQLSARLLSLGYNITRLQGVYPEETSSQKKEDPQKENKEISWFVVDVNNSGNLEDDLFKLGEKFKQDSILFIPKGAINNDAIAYLIGTKPEGTEFIKYKEKIPFEKGRLGVSSPIYTSYVNGRPFIFENADDFFVKKPTGMAIMAYAKALKSDPDNV